LTSVIDILISCEPVGTVDIISAVTSFMRKKATSHVLCFDVHVLKKCIPAIRAQQYMH